MIGGHFFKIPSSPALNLCFNQVCLQSVRHARKPRWLPIAPSKLFRVPTRHVLPHDEEIEWQRLNNNYRTQINSLRRFIIKEIEDKKIMKELHETPADEEAEFQRCLVINESWNKDIAQLRTLRVEEDNERRREEVLMNIENKKIRDNELKRKIEEQIMKQQEESKDFITRENIDEAIEHALANPTSYDFCIDLTGTRKGDSIKAEEPKSPNPEQL